MKKRNIVFKLISIALLSVFLSSCTHEQKDDIYIVFTNDVASTIDGNIGYAGLKGFTDQIRMEHPYVTLVDAGDFYDGDVAAKSKGVYITDLMDITGYEIVAIGNQEFSIGLDALGANMNDADFAFVSCNIKYLGDGEDPISARKPYVIKNYGGTKIAFIGVTTPETTKPGKAAYNAILKDGELLYDFYGGNEGQDLYDQVQKTVDSVRKKVDYVIVLAHLGMNSVMKGYSSYELIANTTGIDAVIDGHSHTLNTGEAVPNKEGINVILTSTGQKFENIGVMTINKDHTFTTVTYPVTYYYDDRVSQMVDEIREKLGN